MFFGLSILTIIILLPLLAALVLAFVPRERGVLFHGVALVVTGVVMVLGAGLFWQFQPGVKGLQFEQSWIWVAGLDIRFHLGLDGLNSGLLFMGTLVAFAAACASWEIRERTKEFYILLLVMTGGILGAFAVQDLFFFYIFHELALIPTFLMIGIWGRGERKNYATFQITLYLVVGSLILLVGLLGLYWQAGSRTFDLVELAAHLRARPIPVAAQAWIFPLLLFGFGILVSLWPFHTWAPLGYASAPTSTAMLHAGVLKKFGVYGLIRIALPMVPEGARYWFPVIAFLCLGNILYCGLVAVRQKDLNLLIGNSSVAHMGFIFLGIASASLLGVTGAVVIMVAHGLLAALAFALSGYLHQQQGTLQMDAMSGLLRRVPFLGTVLLLALMAGCGLPGFPNFIGESLVLFGAWKTFPLVTILAVWGALVIAAVYMLRAIRKILHGPVIERGPALEDARNPWRKLPFVLLLGALLLLGCYPRLLVDQVKPQAAAVLRLPSP
jgi:NADH-quinone oxidoreductase subunit M